MKTSFLEKLITDSIADRQYIRKRLEDNKTFNMIVPFEVKEVFYKLYDASFDINYQLLRDIKLCRSEEYKTGRLYDMYNKTDELFLDFCFEILEYYNIDEDIIF